MNIQERSPDIRIAQALLHSDTRYLVVFSSNQKKEVSELSDLLCGNGILHEELQPFFTASNTASPEGAYPVVQKLLTDLAPHAKKGHIDKTAEWYLQDARVFYDAVQTGHLRLYIPTPYGTISIWSLLDTFRNSKDHQKAIEDKSKWYNEIQVRIYEKISDGKNNFVQSDFINRDQTSHPIEIPKCLGNITNNNLLEVLVKTYPNDIDQIRLGIEDSSAHIFFGSPMYIRNYPHAKFKQVAVKKHNG